MGHVEFVGQAPYALPVAQSATATAVGNTVEVFFRLLTDPSRLETVSIQMTPNQGTELLACLADAIDKALAWGKSHVRKPQRLLR